MSYLADVNIKTTQPTFLAVHSSFVNYCTGQSQLFFNISSNISHPSENSQNIAQYLYVN